MNQSSPPTKRSILSSALLMSVITMGSRFLGLIREQVRAHYLGTSFASDAFGIAFQIPNLLRRSYCRRRDDLRLLFLFLHRPEVIRMKPRGHSPVDSSISRFGYSWSLFLWASYFGEELVLAFAAIEVELPEPELGLLTSELVS